MESLGGVGFHKLTRHVTSRDTRHQNRLENISQAGAMVHILDGSSECCTFMKEQKIRFLTALTQPS